MNRLLEEQDGQTDFLDECKKFLDGNDLTSLIKKVIEHKNVLFEKGTPQDTEGCFSIMASIIGSFVKDQDARTALIDIYVAAVTDKHDHAALRMKM